jgi:hypothetical protein
VIFKIQRGTISTADKENCGWPSTSRMDENVEMV